MSQKLTEKPDIVKLPAMNAGEIEEVLNKQHICRIAFHGQNYPYLIPFQYAYEMGGFYIHFTQYGNKMVHFFQNPQVCVEIEDVTPDMRHYCFVLLNGILSKVDDITQKARVLQKLRQDGEEHFSTNFLTVHGLDSRQGWKNLIPEKASYIMKLEIKEKSGLKSL